MKADMGKTKIDYFIMKNMFDCKTDKKTDYKIS